MKTFFIILTIILIAGAGFFGYKYYIAKDKNISYKKAVTGYNEPFQWGTTMRAAALDRFHLKSWPEQIKYAQSLGIKWARIGWDYDGSLAGNDKVFEQLWNAGINTTLIVELAPSKEKQDRYKTGYDDGYLLANHYKGKIKYYQIMNEVSGQCIKPGNLNGQDESMYDMDKCQDVLAYLKGVSEGIHAADPDAWRIMCIVSTHTAFIDIVNKEKIPFDIIGLNWYDWMGPIGEAKMENGQFLAEKLKTYKKPLIFTEVNANPKAEAGSRDRTIVDENKQSEFISQTAQWAWNNRDWVKGLYVHEFVDNINTKGDLELFGLIAAKEVSSQVGQIVKPRKAFYTYQEIIKKYVP